MGAIITVASKKTNDMVSLKEAAQLLGAGYSSVYKWVMDGKIRAVKIKGALGGAYYIELDELNDFEKHGNYRTRRRAKKLAPKSLIDILETMSDEQQQALLAAVGSTAKILSMPLTGEQLGLVKGTLNNVINGKLLFDIQEKAPELMEVG